MSKRILFFLIVFIVGSMGLWAQETKRLYIDKVSVMLRKPNGNYWDAFKGAPDLKVVISIPDGNKWKPIFISPLYKDSHFISKVINTGVDIAAGTELQVEVIDYDITSHDLIGRRVIVVSVDDLKTSQKKNIQFESVYTFVYFFSSYKTLDITGEQEQRIKIVQDILSQVEQAPEQNAVTSSNMDKAKTEIATLKREIAGHPFVEELELKYKHLLGGFSGLKVKEIIEKLTAARQALESALKNNDSPEQIHPHFANLRKILSELEEYKALDSVKESQETWIKWIMEQENAFSRNQFVRKVEEAKKRLKEIILQSQNSGQMTLEKLKEYVAEATPYVEILEKDQEEWPNIHLDILEKYKLFLKTVQDMESKQKSIPLAVSLYDTIDPVEAGETTGYMIEINNNSGAPVNNIQIIDYIPREASFVSVEITGLEKKPGHKVEENKIVFDSIPTVNPGATIILKITIKINEPGDLRNIIEVQSPGCKMITKDEGTKSFKK